jgi:hypothetical protein
MQDDTRSVEERQLPLEVFEAAAAEESEEDARVLRWRLEQTIELGFELTPAVLLADSPADLNVLRRLIARGCPHETAVEILL